MEWYGRPKVPFERKVLTLDKYSHKYLTGNWYNSAEITEDETWNANFDTTIIWMQNDAGFAKWPVTTDREAKLIRAFKFAKTGQTLPQSTNPPSFSQAGWQPAAEQKGRQYEYY